MRTAMRALTRALTRALMRATVPHLSVGCRRKGHNLPEVEAAVYKPRVRQCARCAYREPVPPTGSCYEPGHPHPLAKHWLFHDTGATPWELVPTNRCSWPDVRSPTRSNGRERSSV